MIYKMRVTEKHILFDTGVLNPMQTSRIKLKSSELEGEFGNTPHIDGELRFYNAEHAILYIKALIFGDRKSMRLIYEARTRKEVRKYGKEISGYDRDIWHDRASYAIYYAVEKRFDQDEDFKHAVLDKYNNGLSFVYCSPFDKVLGNGLHLSNSSSDHEEKWHGKNLYGSAITSVVAVETDTEDDDKVGYYLTPKGIFMMAVADELGDNMNSEAYFYTTDLFAKYDKNMRACGFVKGVKFPGLWPVARLLFVDLFRVLKGKGKMTPKDLLLYTASKMKCRQPITDEELGRIFDKFAQMMSETEYA
jgi:ribA/ribD-fused uncharacterized protein